MTQEELTIVLEKALKLPAETEIIEFKKASNGFDDDELGEYFSALSNEANLKNMPYAWLIFGVHNKTHEVLGSQYKQTRASLDEMKKTIADKTTGRITFMEIYEHKYNGKRVVMFQIPAAPRGIPIAFGGHYYGRDGESLVALNIQEIEQIRAQAVADDWSAAIVPNATIDDLDPKAIRTAREKYLELHPYKEAEMENWDDATFLNKAKITIKGQITNAAIILLGKEESEHFISPAVCKIRWQLKDGGDMNKDFRIFTIPMIHAITDFSHVVRNARYSYMKPGTMFPDTFMRYDGFTLREPLNNAIAHQDYRRGAMIEVIEYEDEKLIFRNHGQFIPSSVEDVVSSNSPESCYRNPFLAEAMRNLHMVETEGGGIRKLFNEQRKRFFPMPDYDTSDGMVRCEIQGKVLDQEFANILIKNPSLSLSDIMLLDRVQKHQTLTDSAVKYLRKNGFVEGRKNVLYLSSEVIKDTGHPKLKAEYIKNKGFDDKYYKGLILQYLKKWNKASRKDINGLLLDKLPASMTMEQKIRKIGNLLASLKKENKIIVNKKRLWELLDLVEF